MQNRTYLRRVLSSFSNRSQTLALIAAASLAVASSAFAASADITGLNGWVQEGNPSEPITVTDEMPFDGNGSLTFGPADWTYAGYNSPAAQLTSTLTSGTVTITAKLFLTAGSNATLLMGADNAGSQYYQNDIEAGGNAQDTGVWETIQTVINLDAAGAPFATTIDGSTPSWDDGSFEGSYNTTADPSAVTEVWLASGPGVNAAATADFFLDDLTVVSSVDGTVFSDNFDSYIAAVPEPASLSLLGLAGAALLGRRRRRI